MSVRVGTTDKSTESRRSQISCSTRKYGAACVLQYDPRNVHAKNRIETVKTERRAFDGPRQDPARRLHRRRIEERDDGTIDTERAGSVSRRRRVRSGVISHREHSLGKPKKTLPHTRAGPAPDGRFASGSIGRELGNRAGHSVPGGGRARGGTERPSGSGSREARTTSGFPAPREPRQASVLPSLHRTREARTGLIASIAREVPNGVRVPQPLTVVTEPVRRLGNRERGWGLPPDLGRIPKPRWGLHPRIPNPRWGLHPRIPNPRWGLPRSDRRVTNPVSVLGALIPNPVSDLYPPGPNRGPRR